MPIIGMGIGIDMGIVVGIFIVAFMIFSWIVEGLLLCLTSL
ncbi:hypothetical protein [Rhodocyclus gracilis]|nr:hypothetical protein [Rhodocyclus gracilis]